VIFAVASARNQKKALPNEQDYVIEYDYTHMDDPALVDEDVVNYGELDASTRDEAEKVQLVIVSTSSTMTSAVRHLAFLWVQFCSKLVVTCNWVTASLLSDFYRLRKNVSIL